MSFASVNAGLKMVTLRLRPITVGVDTKRQPSASPARGPGKARSKRVTLRLRPITVGVNTKRQPSASPAKGRALPGFSEAEGFEVGEHGGLGVAPDDLIGGFADFRQGVGHGDGPAGGREHFQVVQVIAEHHHLR